MPTGHRADGKSWRRVGASTGYYGNMWCRNERSWKWATERHSLTFGGKSTIADVIWSRLGDTPNYVEPFFGSGAVLLNRPHWSPDKSMIETVNDKSAFLANFWRSVQAAPNDVALYADLPVNETDLHARHGWLVRQAADLAAKLEGDPDYYDPKIAGWWCWGAACWIGGGWCSGKGPWQQIETEGGWRLINTGNTGQGVNRQLVHLGNAGQGVNRKLVHLGNAGRGIKRQLVHLGDSGRGVNRQLVHLGDAGTGEQGLYAWMQALSERLARVRVCCGDWSRVCGPSSTYIHGLTAVFLDPPYTAEAGRESDLYEQDSLTVGHEVAAWCKANQDNPLLKIALCGYEGEYDLPGWECFIWKAAGGYGNQSDGRGADNANKERIWFSPHCLKPTTYETLSLFDMEVAA